MEYIPFDQRLGFAKKAIIANDFPQSARIGFLYIVEDLIESDFIQTGSSRDEKYKLINLEIARICRIMDIVKNDSIHPEYLKMPWNKVFELIERIYLKLLKEVNEYDINGNIINQIKSITEVRNYYSNEIKTLIFEEHLGFDYRDGVFYRRGYLKTSQSIATVTTAVLSDPKLEKARVHYLKALQFFNSIKTPDYENAIKEAICAVEACLIALFSTDISKSFENIKKLIGTEKNKAPAPIIEAIIKIYGYRNSGDGVAHATSKGLKVTEKETELIIALTADYITYFYALLRTVEEDVPF